VRIISGTLKGRTLHEPHGHKTHPMSEKVRGAIFNALGDVEGLSFLDAYAGTGALSIEAISRGAASAVAIDKDRSAHDVLDKNIADLKLKDKIRPVRANAGGWSIHNMEKKFDIVLLDPPYDQVKTDQLQTLINRHVKTGGLAVVSFPGHADVPEFERTELVADKHYGDSQLLFYRKLK
jgi:16S rRNA (guanine966-N2)-methyltransferase